MIRNFLFVVLVGSRREVSLENILIVLSGLNWWIVIGSDVLMRKVFGDTVESFILYFLGMESC